MLRGFWDEMARRGVSLAALEERSGVRRPRPGDFFSGVDRADLARLYTCAIELTRSPHLGLSMGRALGPSAFHLLGHLALACATLPEALQLCERAYPQAGFRLPVLEPVAGGMTRFGFANQPADPSPGERFDAEFKAVLLHDLLLHFLDLDLARPTASFAFAAPEDIACYREFFAGEVEFAAGGTFLMFPSAAIVPARSGSNVELKQQLFRLAREHYGAQEEVEHEWTHRVRSALRAHPVPLLLPAPKLAGLLGVSARELWRRLRAEGTTSSALINEELFARAKALLRRPGATTAQVASALGYAELSSFFRAFHRWSGGLTPAEYRDRGADA